MPRHDYRCETCGAMEYDVFHAPNALPDSLDCSCGGNMSRYYGAFNFNDHWGGQAAHGENSMYGKYHYGFGCVVESYAHKQQLLRQYDVSEAADPVGGSRSWRDQTEDPQTKTYDKAIELTKEEVVALERGDQSKQHDIAARFARRK